jgi:hypothetical protein
LFHDLIASCFKGFVYSLGKTIMVQFETKERINRMDRIDRIKAMLKAEG